MFASSHADYPAWRYVFPDPPQRQRALSVFFAATVRDALPFGAVDAAVANGEVLGIAVWLPPGRFPWSVSRKLRAAPAMLGVLRAAPARFWIFARLGANAERLHPTYPHWHLETLGIRSEAQGRGIGTRLMAPGLTRADQAGLPCYLTTADGSISRSTSGLVSRWRTMRCRCFLVVQRMGHAATGQDHGVIRQLPR